MILHSISSLLVLSLQWHVASSFLPQASQHNTWSRRPAPDAAAAAASSSTSSTALEMAKLEVGDTVMLVGPGFLQLVIAKHAKAAGLKPIVVAAQTKLDSFFSNICLDDQIQRDSTIGMPETGDPYFGEIKGVVFCAEDAILPSEFVSRVLDFTHDEKSPFANGAPARVVCCLPVDGKVKQEKAASWIPIFNNDKSISQNWKNFNEKYSSHPVYKSDGGVGSIIRFGSAFGGSIDGPSYLRDMDLALEECMYKVSRRIKHKKRTPECVLSNLTPFLFYIIIIIIIIMIDDLGTIS
jgi:hypothetical protein